MQGVSVIIVALLALAVGNVNLNFSDLTENGDWYNNIANLLLF
jgi:hypothetical protein